VAGEAVEKQGQISRESKCGVCRFCRRWTCLFLFLFTMPREYKPSLY